MFDGKHDPDAWPRAILAGWPCRESAHSSYLQGVSSRLDRSKQRGNLGFDLLQGSLPSPVMAGPDLQLAAFMMIYL